MTHLDFVDHVEGIGVACICKDNLVQCIGDSICRRATLQLFKSVPKVCSWVGDSSVSAQHNESGDGNEEERNDFDKPNDVAEPV